jgi:peptidoglycan-associated lipoprotein
MKDIQFDFDRYTLSADSQEVLQRNAEWLKDNPWAQVQIEGHADDRGTSEYNLALGAKRAEAAKAYLVAQGVSPERLSTISYGEELPVCRERAEGCWQRNRRAHSAIVTIEVGSAR